MAAPLGHALAVRVEEGRHFPRDAGAAFRVAATFDDEPRSTVRLPSTPPSAGMPCLPFRPAGARAASSARRAPGSLR
jgi:hypothetical protein